MPTRRTLALLLGIFFAGAVFVFNALPSSVFVDDSDSKLVPGTERHLAHSGGSGPVETGVVIVTLLVALGMVQVVRLTTLVPAHAKLPVARGPPSH